MVELRDLLRGACVIRVHVAKVACALQMRLCASPAHMSPMRTTHPELSGVEVPGQEALLFLEKMPLAEGHEREEREQMVAALQAAMRNAETADVSGSATEAAKSALLQVS